jgi:hypothetical protein
MIELAQKLNPGIDFQQGNMAALDVEDGFGQASWPSTPSPAPLLERSRSDRSFCTIKRILDQSIMQPAKHEQPGKQSHSTHTHGKAVLKACHSWSTVFDLKAMCPMNTRASKPEEDSSTRFIRFNNVTNWAVTSHRSDPQWTVEAHSRPAIMGPE